MISIKLRRVGIGLCWLASLGLAGTAAAQAPPLPNTQAITKSDVPSALTPTPITTIITEGPVVQQDQGDPAPGEPVNDPGLRGAPIYETPASAGTGGCKPWWSRVPVITPTARVGWFLTPPTGPGYYSLQDVVTNTCREKPPKYGYPRFGFLVTPFFDVDWKYLDDPKNKDTDLFDPLKRMKIGEHFMLTTGGEVRYRYNNFTNFNLTGRNNQFDLLRTRIFADLWFRDRVRIFAEAVNSQSFNQDLPPAPPDRNFGDFLNLFAEFKLWDFDGNPVHLRAGRQEMIFGSQRLISTVDWLNNRRNFDGLRGFYRSEKFDFDLFVMQPTIFTANKFDSVDNNQVFSGAWGTYRPKKDQTIDLYYLNLDNTNPTARGANGQLGAANTSTVGSRYAGNYKNVLWDVEGMLQFGDFSNQSTFATAYTTGIGYNFKDLPMNPSVWLYYDFASGDPNPGVGNQHQTFNQLFGFGHYYFGWIDVVGRQNIHDLNAQLSFYPTKWITTQVQYHVFRLDEAKDSLYAANGASLRRDPTGLAGTNVGQEIDLLVNFHLTKHQDVAIGYSHLFAGDFLRQTGSGRDVDFVYAQWGFRW